MFSRIFPFPHTLQSQILIQIKFHIVNKILLRDLIEEILKDMVKYNPLHFI